MRGSDERDARESRLASGWTVEGTAEAATDRVAEDPASQTGVAEPTAHTDSAVDAGNSDVDSEDGGESAGEGGARTQLGAGMLVLLGVLGGLFLLYTIVWFSWAKYYTDAKHDEWVITMGSFGAVLQTILFLLAAAAPALWFLTALAANRGKQTGRLLVWILIGAVVLVPVPMFVGGIS